MSTTAPCGDGPTGTFLDLRAVSSDADVEHLRRAMVDAHETLGALDRAMSIDHTWTGAHSAIDRARSALVAAARTYEDAVYLAKRARGGW